MNVKPYQRMHASSAKSRHQLQKDQLCPEFAEQHKSPVNLSSNTGSKRGALTPSDSGNVYCPSNDLQNLRIQSKNGNWSYTRPFPPTQNTGKAVGHETSTQLPICNSSTVIYKFWRYKILAILICTFHIHSYYNIWLRIFWQIEIDLPNLSNFLLPKFCIIQYYFCNQKFLGVSEAGFSQD